MFNVWLPHSPSQYIGQMAGLEGIDCAAVKHDCETRYPDDGGPYDSPAQKAFDGCLRIGGYYEKGNHCYEGATYANPGATTYPIDVVTNPDNPDFIFKPLADLAGSMGISPWLLLGGAAAALIVLPMLASRR